MPSGATPPSRKPKHGAATPTTATLQAPPPGNWLRPSRRPRMATRLPVAVEYSVNARLVCVTDGTTILLPSGVIMASPVLAEGRIYFQSEDGVGYVVKAGTAFEQISENDLGERSLASCAVTDGAIFIRTANHLWRIGADGK